MARIDYSDPVTEDGNMVMRKTSYSLWDEKNSRYIYFNYTYVANLKVGILDSIDFSIISVSDTNTSVLYALSISNTYYTPVRISIPSILILALDI